MPITAGPLEHPNGHWHGWAWTVDESALAPYVAHVALGNYRYLQSILHELDGERTVASTFPDSVTIAGARELLLAADPENPYHRDGWLFQTLSWIAARLNENGSLTLCQPPHMIHAHKGLDALELTLCDNAASLERMIIGEDKATENTRPTVRKVWKEIKQLESGTAGSRRNLIRSGVSNLLDRRPELDAIGLIDQIVWQTVTGYRVAVTDCESGAPSTRAAELFKGFEGVVAGGTERRQVALLYVEDLRPWMKRLAGLALDYLDTLEP